MSFTVSPSNWENSPECFAYVCENNKCWVFNGIDKAFIHYEMEDGGTISYDNVTWKKGYPEAFLLRLPPNLRKEWN